MRRGTLLTEDVCTHMMNGDHDKAMESLANHKKVSKGVKMTIFKKIQNDKQVSNP